MTYTHRVELSTNSHVVPDSSPLADNHFSDKSSIRSDPCISYLWNGVVERHSLTVARRLLQVSDVVCIGASKSIKFYVGKLCEDDAKECLKIERYLRRPASF